jgi:hypothetical protein
MSERAKYLYITIKDVDPEIEEEYAKWMNEEHMPDLLTVPGIIRALRYVSHGGGSPKHMAVYEMASPDIPKGEAWSHAAHTERSKYMKAHWQGKAQNIFELVAVLEPRTAKKPDGGG